jgi:hypothetical protein
MKRRNFIKGLAGLVGITLLPDMETPVVPSPPIFPESKINVGSEQWVSDNLERETTVEGWYHPPIMSSASSVRVHVMSGSVAGFNYRKV